MPGDKVHGPKKTWSNSPETIEDELVFQLSEISQKFPDRLQKHVYVLETVESEVHAQLQQRLRQAKMNYEGERIALIPYLSDDYHWIGILLKFNVTGNIEYAELLDPVVNSTLDVKLLQTAIDLHYPGTTLQERELLLKHKDPKRSAKLTIDNFLEAVAHIESPTATIKRDSGERQTDDSKSIQNTISRKELINERLFSLKSYDELLVMLKNGFEERDIQNKEELLNDLREKREEIERLELRKKNHVVQRRKNSLQELEALWTLFERKEMLDILKSEELNKNNREKGSDFEISEERLIDLCNDIHDMPSCSEKSVRNLLLYSYLRLGNIKSIRDSRFLIPDDLTTEIKKEMVCLREALGKEELFTTENESLCENLTVYIQNEHWKHVVALLNILKTRISPLDVRELHRIVGKVDDAARSIEGKQIILFLGGTGVGKSTTIHFLAGSEFVDETVNGLNHLVPKNVKYSELQKIITAPFACAQTRYITAVTINVKRHGRSSSDIVTLCDSPGFCDTRGAEVDIANGIGIVRAVKGCEQVKPVVLISNKSIGDRCHGLKDLAETLVSLVPNIQDHLSSFSYIFTKFSSDEKHGISAMLRDLLEKLSNEDKLDDDYKAFIKDVHEKSEKNLIVLDPRNDEPEDLLKQLIRSPKISHPDEVFHVFISNKSKTILYEQVRIDQICIVHSMQRYNYQLIDYKLDQLNFLYHLVSQAYIDDYYKASIASICDHLNNQYEIASDALNRYFEGSIVLNEEDIQLYQKFLTYSEEAENLRMKHLSQTDTKCSDAFKSYLDQKIVFFCEQLRKKEINDESISMDLDKLRIVTNYFPSYIKTYQEVCLAFEEKVRFVREPFQLSVKSHDFEKSASYLLQLGTAMTILHQHIEREYVDQLYQQLKEYLLCYLQKNLLQQDIIFTRDNLTTIDVEEMNQKVSIIEAALNTHTLHTHLSKESLSNIYEQFSTTMMNHFENILNQFTAALERTASSNALEVLMNKLALMRRVPIVEFKSSLSYNQAVEKLVEHFRGIISDIEGQIEEVRRPEESVSHQSLIKKLVSLQEHQWIENYRSEVYSILVNNIHGETISYVAELKKSVISVSLDLDNYESIGSTCKKLIAISEFKPLETIIPGIYSEYFLTTKEHLLTVLQNQIDLINLDFSIEQWTQKEFLGIDFEKLEKSFQYLNRCRQILFLEKKDCERVLDSLGNFVAHFSRHCQGEMEKSLDAIMQSQTKNHDDLFSYVRTLERRLEEISLIRDHYPTVFSHFVNRKINERWQGELSHCHFNLSDTLEESIKIQRCDTIMHQLTTAKALIKLDKFFNNQKFRDLHRKYQDLFYNFLVTIQQELLQAIKNHQFEGVSLQIEILMSFKDFADYFVEPIKRELNKQIENLIDQTRTEILVLDNNMDIEKVKLIVDKLRELQRAKKYTSQYLNASSAIDTRINVIYGTLAERIQRFMQSIEGLIYTNSFDSAEKKIQQLTSVARLLDHLVDPTLLKTINRFREERLFARLDTLVSEYSTMNISRYRLESPDNLLMQLAQAQNIDTKYIEVHTAITESILTKCQSVLDDAQEIEPIATDSEYIQQFETAIVYIPEFMQKSLERKLVDCKNDILARIRQPEDRLNRECQRDNVKNMKSILEQYQRSNEMQPYFIRGKECLGQHIQDLIKTVKRFFDENAFEKALDNVERLNQYRLELSNFFPDLNKSCEEIKCQMGDLFDKAYNSFVDQYLGISSSIIVQDTENSIQRNFSCLCEFLKFSDRNKDKIGLNELFSEALSQNIRLLHERIALDLIKSEQKFDEALKNFDTNLLKSLLKVAKQWYSLLLFMKKHYCTNLLTKSLTDMTLFPEMLKVIALKLRACCDYIIDVELINDRTKHGSESIDQFYRELNEKFIVFDRAQVLHDIDLQELNLEKFRSESIRSLEDKIMTLARVAYEILEKVLQGVQFSRTEYDCFVLYFAHIKSYEKEMTSIHSLVPSKTHSIEERVRDKVTSWKSAIESTADASSIMKILAKMKETSKNLSNFEFLIEEKICEALSGLKNSKHRRETFERLMVLLSVDETKLGQMLLNEQRAFQSYHVSWFNEKAQGYGIEYVLQNIEGDVLDKNKLRQYYDEYWCMYASLVKQYLKPRHALEPLIIDIRSLAHSIKQQDTLNQGNFDTMRKNQIIKLLARIFALWTLQRTDPFCQDSDIDKLNSAIMQPQATQVIAVFRMLGLGVEKEGFTSSLIQIGTGEGKSIVLGIMACFFALIGFDVYCTCFSEYLSHEDHQSFTSLFDSLEIQANVHYGSFSSLYECIINEPTNIRSIVEQYISKDTLNRRLDSHQSNTLVRVLLVDEVDMLFNRHIYNNIYIPSICLTDSTISALIDYIWTQRKSSTLNLSNIRSTSHYNNCCLRFPKWKVLIDEAVQGMLLDLASFEHHEYIVQDDRIGYSEYDTVNFNAVDGYKTLFAYYREHEKCTISQRSLEMNRGIIVRCGQYCYADIISQFKYIMGVSGTISALNEPSKAVLKDIFNINQQTTIPSLFGKSNLKFRKKEDLRIETNADYYSRIYREIDERLTERTIRRAVLVFFESETKLKDFYVSKIMESIRGSVAILTEQVCTAERHKIIRCATISGRITLLTRAFSRGIDFKCFDQIVVSNGGVHVIQTFLSEDISEEIQIQNRVARYGFNGSYSMILCDTDLEKFQIERVDLENVRDGKPIPVRSMKATRSAKFTRRYETVYDFLNERRKLFCNTRYEESMEQKEKFKRSAVNQQKFLSHIQSVNIDGMRECLLEQNKAEVLVSKLRIGSIGVN